MQWLAEICVRRPVFATVIILALSVIGFFGYTKLGTDRFPKVDFPIVTVVLQQDGGLAGGDGDGSRGQSGGGGQHRQRH